VKLLKRYWNWVKKCKEYEKWISSAFIAILFFFALCLIRSNTNPENARYILSAISQGFAAIFALVFTITLIVAQLTGSYAIILKKENEFIFLMVVFGVGIIIPLIILDFGFWCWWVNGAIAFSIFCIVALIQHFAGIIKEELKYAWIEKLPGEIVDAIGLGNIPRAAREIKDLGMLGIDMAKKGEEDQVMYVIRGLRLAGLEAVGKGKEFEDIASASINELREVGLEATRKKLDAQKARALFSDNIIGFTGVPFSATASALDALKDVGTKAAEADMGDATLSAIDYLVKVGIAAMENGLNQDTINEVVLGLEEVGKKSAEKRLTYFENYFVVVQAVEKLMEFGNKALKYEYGRIFSWGDVPGNDSDKLQTFLEGKIYVGWAKNAKIRKTDDGKAIIVSNGTNSLSLRLNEEKTKVTLTFDNGKTHEFIVKTKNGELNIIYIGFIVNVLWVLSAASIEYSVDFDFDIGEQVIQFVRDIPSEAPTIVDLFEKGFDNGRIYIDKKFPDLVGSLGEFKKRYEER